MTARPDLLDITAAAQRLGMSTRHVRRLVAERRIAHHKLGRAVRFDRADLDAYIAATRIEPITATDAYRALTGAR